MPNTPYRYGPEERVPLKPPPHVVARLKVHAELAAAGFELVGNNGVHLIRRIRDGKPFVEGIDLDRVLQAFRANRHRTMRAA